MKISLDIDDLIQEFNLPTNTADFIVHSCVEEVTNSIYEEWKKAAADKLKSTRTDYIEGLDIVTVSKFSRSIILRGSLNNMIEKGTDPYDMKEHFRKSKKVKYSVSTDKNGEVSFRWYLTIPFRIGTPGIVGENSAFSGVMPKSIHKIMQAMPANTGLKKSQIPSPHDIPETRAPISIPSKKINIPAYTHKSSKFAGMQKNVGAYGKANQNTYNTFRRVGENSDPNSWIHSGIKAYNLLGDAMGSTDVSTIVENKVDEILENLGYGS
jgi:hypothetical protein